MQGPSPLNNLYHNNFIGHSQLNRPFHGLNIRAGVLVHISFGIKSHEYKDSMYHPWPQEHWLHRQGDVNGKAGITPPKV